MSEKLNAVPVRSNAVTVRAARLPVSAADLTLRGLWQLVGVYVWVVLLFKRRVPARRYD
ncbi:hypothetical protein [Cryobacterium psychrophilum]|uniref:hypothetical protein n=1 Tax=Cryobacterium psychrophilum TaxID=41988 RepID=UPI0010D27329|nr:hypothetical protein [Cryobacterium psychrophilum]TDW29490.1 hypothetical protein EDD25_1189 [Cryobacterium psychrophilum]